MNKSTELYRLRRKLALHGSYYNKPLLLVNVTLILCSYFSYLFFPVLSKINVVHFISSVGYKWVPIVNGASGYAINSFKCIFVMSLQWLLSFMYIYIFFILYLPSSRLTRVAMHKWYSNNVVPNKKLGGAIFFIFMILYIMGDIGFIKFPTFFNGVFFSVGYRLNYFYSIINSPVVFPIFAWFCPFATFAIYWACFNFACNFRIIFDLKK